MSIDAMQLRELVIRPTLKHMGAWSLAAENLLMGTAAQESRLGTYLFQIPEGPAQGIYQMEPATAADIWDNYLNYRPKVADPIWMIRGGMENPLIWNLAYQTAMARVHYLRVAEPLPVADDVAALAQYWKRYYNTPAGKGTEAEFIENYYRYVAEGH